MWRNTFSAQLPPLPTVIYKLHGFKYNITLIYIAALTVHTHLGNSILQYLKHSKHMRKKSAIFTQF